METESLRSERSAVATHIADVTVIDRSKSSLEKEMASPRPKDPIMKRFMRWLVPDQRVATRHSMPPLVAYLGMVRSSKEIKIGDVSVAGFYMITEERWIPGTGFPVTLERTDEAGKGQTLTVYATVVRNGPDGVGLTFLESPEEEQAKLEGQGSRKDLTKLAQFLKGLPMSENSAETLERAS